MSTLTDAQNSIPEALTTFSRVLVGIDGSPESLEAAGQAALLEEPGGTLELPGGLEPRAADRDARVGAAGLRHGSGRRSRKRRACSVHREGTASVSRYATRARLSSSRSARRDRAGALDPRGRRIPRPGPGRRHPRRIDCDKPRTSRPVLSPRYPEDLGEARPESRSASTGRPSRRPRTRPPEGSPTASRAS